MKKIKLFTYLICSCFSLSLFAQELDWLKNSTSVSNFTTHSFYCSTQHNNDFYFAGDFWPDLTIDGVNIEVGLDTGNGFIIKMDESGTSSGLWHFESNNYVRISKMEVNPVSGNLIVVGSYRENLNYNNDSWEALFYGNGFIMSIFPDGTLDWMREIEGQTETSGGGGNGIAIDQDGNIYIGMTAYGTVIIDNQSFTFEPETSGAIIAKFNIDGDLLLADTWKSETFEGGLGILNMVMDANEDLVIVGSASGAMVIGDSTYLFSEETEQCYLLKQDKDLNVQWFKTYGGTSSQFRDVYADETDLILSLQYYGAINVDGEQLTGSNSWGDMAILSLNENAELQWVKNFTLSTNGGISGVYGVSISAWLDQYYIGGMYQGDVVHDGVTILDNGPGVASYQYPFILSLSKEGELTSAYDFVGSTESSRISTISASNSHLFFGGDFSGQVSMGDSSVNTINSALFYGALATELSAIDQLKDNNHLIEVYPSLASDYLNIKTEASLDKITLASSVGVVLKAFSKEDRVIDISELSAGHYYLLTSVDGARVVSRFVKVD